MKNILLILTTTLIFLSHSNLYAANSAKLNVKSIESRYTGYHAVYLTGAIPNQSCKYNDRAIIVETTDGGKTMLSLALTALVTGQKVVVGVSGCAPLSAGSSSTAPKVVKVQIYN